MKNREIKFRGQRLTNGEWVYGGAVYTEHLDIGYHIMPHMNLLIQVKNITICQYTGLNGKNGVEIYEDDLIKHNSRIFHLRYSEKLYHFVLECINEKTDSGNSIFHSISWMRTCSKYCEVIGNIYENPELL